MVYYSSFPALYAWTSPTLFHASARHAKPAGANGASASHLETLTTRMPPVSGVGG